MKKMFKAAAVIAAMVMALAIAGCGNGNDDPDIPEKTITLTFDTDGGSSVPSQTVKEGEHFTKPADPTKDGYEFWGWYGVDSSSGQLDPGVFDFDLEYWRSGTVRAKWLPVFNVTAGNIAETIKAMRETGKIIASGAFTENDFTKEGGIRDALLELLDIENPQYSWDPKILVTLDLSAVTGLTKIPDNAFFEYSEAMKDENGNEITDMDKYRKCQNLTGIMLPSSIKSIGDRAFAYCTKLKSIELPEGVEKIEKRAFSYCSGLESITLPSTLKEIDQYAFRYCYNNALESITLPAGLKVIGDNAFADCISLKCIEIPGGVEKIGAGAFLYCRWLEDVIIHDGVKSIGDEAFRYVYALKTIIIPDSVEEIGEEAFYCPGEDGSYEDSSLESITFGTGIKEIGARAFANCKKLKSATFKDTESTWMVKDWDQDDNDYKPKPIGAMSGTPEENAKKLLEHSDERLYIADASSEQ